MIVIEWRKGPPPYRVLRSGDDVYHEQHRHPGKDLDPSLSFQWTPFFNGVTVPSTASSRRREAINGGHDTSDKSASRINELTVALGNMERKLAEREALVTAAVNKTETARAQYAQANERAEALRRRLDAQDQESSPLHSQLEASTAELKASRELIADRDRTIASLEHKLQKRDDRIAVLEKICTDNDNALNAINEDAARFNSTNPSERVAAMGLVMESLEPTGMHYGIRRATTTIGRVNANDIAFDSHFVSRYHARIVVETEGSILLTCKVPTVAALTASRLPARY